MVDKAKRMKGRLALINKQIFILIQGIQNFKRDDLKYKHYLRELERIEEGLKSHWEETVKIKDREDRKSLLQQLVGCKERCTGIMEVLRTHHLKVTNDMIAQLNNLAYRGIKKAGL